MMESFSGIGAERYLLYLFTEGAMAISPGTAVLYVVNRGMAQGFVASTAATWGVILVNTLYFIASALGLSLLALQYPTLFKGVQMLGACYLLYLAYGAWTARQSPLSLSSTDTSSYWQTLKTSTLLQMANPKALLTFVAIVPPFVNVAHPVAPQMVWLALGSVIPEILILFAYGALASRARPYLNDLALRRLIERVCAVLLLAIACLVFWV
jgi:homoserine/homoserine lactone efflux protein